MWGWRKQESTSSVACWIADITNTNEVERKSCHRVRLLCTSSWQCCSFVPAWSTIFYIIYILTIIRGRVSAQDSWIIMWSLMRSHTRACQVVMCMETTTHSSSFHHSVIPSWEWFLNHDRGQRMVSMQDNWRGDADKKTSFKSEGKPTSLE